MTAHAKVTIIGHAAAGMGQVWYRVTGNTGVGNVQVAYRAGAGAEDARRVRFVGAGATAELVGFRPGELVADPVDYLHIALAFSGRYLTRGVKMQRSKLARVPAGPIHEVVVAAMVRAGLDPASVFASRDAGNWWRAVSRAAERDRSVSFLTATGVLRAAVRAGMNVEESELHCALGRSTRTRLTGPVTARREQDAVQQLDLDALEVEKLSDKELGERVWRAAEAASACREPVGNAGYELTLTLPKSISLYALTGDPAAAGEWLDVMETAATRALERLMAEAGFCSTGHRGEGQNVMLMPADGWAGFIATELSSRAGDPHLHVHCTLPNVLVGRDGIVRTMADGGRELHVNAPRFAAWGQEFVIAEAQARGLLGEVWFNPQTAQWEAGGFSDDTLWAFSRGRQAVLAEEADADDGQPISASDRGARNRAAKKRATAAKADEQPTWAQLHERMLARANELRVDLAAERDATGERFASPSMWSDRDWVDWVSYVACQHESVTSLAKIRSIVDLATAGMPEAERSRITRLVVEDGFVRAHASRDRGMRSGGQQWISKSALDAETRLLEHMSASAHQAPGLTWRTGTGISRFQADRGWQLSGEQQRAVQAIVDGTAQVTLISGVGGSGKTSVLAAAHMGLAGEWYGLLVTSTATRAASAAGHESGAPWVNLTALVHRITSGQPVHARVIVVDEASMADVATLARVADYCAQKGKRLVLQGDHAQLRAVGAGDAFNVLCSAHPDSVIRLEVNQRQRTEVGRAVAGALHARDLDTAWEHLIADGAVLVARNRAHKLDLVASTMVREISALGAENVTCDAVTNAEVDDLNDRIHARLLAAGTLDPAAAVVYQGRSGQRVLAPGTVLRVRTPVSHRDPTRRLVRGDRAVVVHAGRDEVCVRFDDGKQRRLKPNTLLRHLDYGYVGTTHTVQGQTSEVHIASLSPTKDAASLYVSASRARERTLFVADARDYLSDKEMRAAAQWHPADLDDEVLERVHAVLAGREEHLDSPRRALGPVRGLASPSYRSGIGFPGSGMSLR
ncbi:MAG: AAA family ATPase [Actinomycetota bacterium]|nr:AAA family ATPase [Actinomycetota bacterium]